MAAKKKRKVTIILVVFLIVGALIGYNYYNKIWGDNVVDNEQGYHYLYIKTGAEFTDVVESLKEEEFLHSIDNFKWVAEKKKNTQKR